ncbi:MAG: PorV/PorQ family protein [Ignavibacteriales bacterium]|nr:PorV/PorQ family protein [Ignavibacteriales bacterium]
MKTRIMLLGLLLCVVMTSIVSAQGTANKRIGTAAATELLIPVGARDLAMGGSSLATTSGVDAIYWNPAGLVRMKSSAEGMFSSMTYIGDIGVSYGAVGASFGEFGAVGLSVKSLNFGSIPLTTNDDPENISGRFFSPTYVTVGLSYSRGLTEAVGVGVTLKVVSEQIERASASGFALDFGIQYSGLVGVKGVNLGVALKNVGPQMKYDGPGLYRNAISPDGSRPQQKYKSEAASFELPSLIEIGLSYDAKAGDNMVWSLNGSFTNNNLYLDEYRVGGEIGMMLESVKLYGRAGVGMVPQAEAKENIFGATFGAGLNYAVPGVSITVDYAYRQVQFFDANNVFSVKLGF